MAKDISKKAAILEELKRRKEAKQAADAKPKLSIMEHCFDKQAAFILDQSKFKSAVCSRRSGKCRKEGTLVKTPTGSVPIEKLKPGDKVYGYDNDGQVRVCEVVQLHDQGIKEVVDLVWNKQVVATSTLDHRWLAHNTHKGKREVKRLKDFNTRDRIAEEYVPIPGGTKEVKEAYALGALLGDSCSNKNNYTWRLNGSNPKDENLKLYNKWCRNKYAHEKILDLEEVRNWTRKSQLELLAGLIDTDGSVRVTKDGRLLICLSMQAKSVIDACEMLILDLFQCKPVRRLDNRKKYKNGPVHEIIISNNKFSKRILKELPIVTERKKWKSEYEKLNERNTNQKYTGFKLSKPYKAQCYDITVNNDSHLFLDANGLIGHNTVACAVDLTLTCLQNTNVNCLYITLNRMSAKRIIWKDLLKIIKDYELNVKINASDLTITFLDTDSTLYISGAKDASEIEKFRGMALKKVYIDECQSFRSYLRDLIDDVIVPALWDHDGSLILIGTPGPICAGVFYEACVSKEWSHHHWTIMDNPWILKKSGKTPQQVLAEDRKRKGINELNPSYRREGLGEWVEDLDSLVFKYDDKINHYDRLPEGKYEYIMGIDVGYNDADAIAIMAYNHKQNKVFLVEEYIKPKQTISQLATAVRRIDAKYKCVKKVIDAGALGKKIQEELIARYRITVEPAEKTRKIEFIEYMNADLRKGLIKIKASTVFAEESKLVTWDYDKSTPDRLKISTSYHSDICDAVLYAYRECRHYFQEKDHTGPARNSDDYMKQLEEKEAARMEAKKNGNDFGLSEEDIQEFEDLVWS